MKKPPEQSDEEKRSEEIRRILSETSPEFKKLKEEVRSDVETKSRDYKTFKEEEESEKISIYEKLCNFSEKLGLEPDKGMAEKMQKAIDFAHLKITPKGAFSFAVFAGIFLIFLTVVGTIAMLAVAGTLNMSAVMLFFGLSAASILVLVKYPEFIADNFRIKASQEIVLAIIYMVIYMRTSPQMEGAVRFAAKNLSGPLAYDLRKVLWDVETRKFETIQEAITDYLGRWEKNKEFAEAIQLMSTSLEQSEGKRYQMLDEAINIILQGTEEKMKRYSQSLRTPVTVIYALGITLPILVLVLFPILMLMLSETINPALLVIGYDVILPIAIFVVSYEVLRRRPIGYSTPDITLHPKYSPMGKIKLIIMGKEKLMPLWPVCIIVSAPIVAVGVLVMLLDSSPVGFINLLGSIIVVWGMGIGLAVVFMMESRTKIGLRSQVKKIQDEFSEALFQLGNRLALGNPMERAMEQTIEKSSGLTISELFRKALNNIKKCNLALEAALFDKKFGAVWEYPSKLVINVMRIIMESAKKGVKNAAVSAISISRYVKQIHSIEESLIEMLSESTASMRVLGLFIGPLIAGVTVTMTAVMMMIFNTLGGLMQGLELTEGGAAGMGMSNLLIGSWGNVGAVISVGVFQIVVGLYMIEVGYLLAYLVSGIENGEGDIIARRELAGWNILIGLLVYSFTIMVTYFIFAPMVGTLIRP